MAWTAANTAAAPAMSHFMVYMPSPGLRFRPPESKVMPLPTRARWLPGAARGVAQPDQPGRPGRPRADREDAAVAAAAQRLLVQDLDGDSCVLDGVLHLLGERVRVEQVGGQVHPFPGGVHRLGDHPGPLVTSSAASFPGRSPARTATVSTAPAVEDTRAHRARTGSCPAAPPRPPPSGSPAPRRPATPPPRSVPDPRAPAACRTPAPAARRRSSGVGSSVAQSDHEQSGASRRATGSVRVWSAAALAPDPGREFAHRPSEPLRVLLVDARAAPRPRRRRR